MNIGIDIDDTVTFTYETLLNLIAIKYGMNFEKLINKKPTYDMFDNLFPNYRLFVEDNFPTVAKLVPLKKNVVEILNKLKKQGHKIIFISARNTQEYKDPYKLSYEYLKSNNIPFDKLIVNVKDKAKECVLQQIDLFIDDDTNNCKAVKKVGIETWQFSNVFTVPSNGLKRVDSWDDVYNKVQEMYT